MKSKQKPSKKQRISADFAKESTLSYWEAFGVVDHFFSYRNRLPEIAELRRFHESALRDGKASYFGMCDAIRAGRP